MRLNVVPVPEARFGLKATRWFVLAVTTVVVTIPVPVALINKVLTDTAGSTAKTGRTDAVTLRE